MVKIKTTLSFGFNLELQRVKETAGFCSPIRCKGGLPLGAPLFISKLLVGTVLPNYQMVQVSRTKKLMRASVSLNLFYSGGE